MAYMTITQVAFQLIAGFSVTSVFMPKSILQQGPKKDDLKIPDNSVVRSANMIIQGVQSLAGAPISYRTLQQDIEALQDSYKWCFVIGVPLLLLAGGAPAVAGGGACVYFSGEDGHVRYKQAKRWINQQNGTA